MEAAKPLVTSDTSLSTFTFLLFRNIWKLGEKKIRPETAKNLNKLVKYYSESQRIWMNINSSNN